MAAIVATARAGECLDALVWRAIGAGVDAVPAVLNANRGLSRIASALPEGHAVTLPEIAPAPATLDIIQLWD